MASTERQLEVREAVNELLDNMAFGKSIAVPATDCPDYSGIYVLFLEGGTYYVGRAENIAKRLRQHLAGTERTNRVQQLRCLPAKARHLRELEQEVLELVEDAGAPVMNIDLAKRSATTLPFDGIISHAEQDTWIRDPAAISDDGPRRELPAQRSKYRERFVRFSELPEAAYALAFLRLFVRSMIPRPRATEGEYYVVSCLPSTGGGNTVVRINAGRQELAAMRWGDDGGTMFYVMTPVISLRRTLSSLLRTRPGLDVVERAWRAGGRDQGAVIAGSLADVESFLRHPAVGEQLRRFSLRVIRGGRAFWRNSHCPQVLDGLL